MDKVLSLYIDSPIWETIKRDDFIVAVGKLKTNSVYHVAHVRSIPNSEKRITRHHLRVFKSDLLTAIKRDPEQRIIPMTWYKRG